MLFSKFNFFIIFSFSNALISANRDYKMLRLVLKSSVHSPLLSWVRISKKNLCLVWPCVIFCFYFHLIVEICILTRFRKLFENPIYFVLFLSIFIEFFLHEKSKKSDFSQCWYTQQLCTSIFLFWSLFFNHIDYWQSNR